MSKARTDKFFEELKKKSHQGKKKRKEKYKEEGFVEPKPKTEFEDNSLHGRLMSDIRGKVKGKGKGKGKKKPIKKTCKDM